MTAGDDSTPVSGSDAESKLGDQFKESEAEAEPYVGTDEGADGDDQNDDAVAAGADPNKQDGRLSRAEQTQEGLPGVAAAAGLRRG